MAFRYPFDKKGNFHLEKLSLINLPHLREAMNRIANLLSCLADDIGERQEWQSEMEADMQGDIAFY